MQTVKGFYQTSKKYKIPGEDYHIYNPGSTFEVWLQYDIIIYRIILTVLVLQWILTILVKQDPELFNYWNPDDWPRLTGKDSSYSYVSLLDWLPLICPYTLTHYSYDTGKEEEAVLTLTTLKMREKTTIRKFKPTQFMLQIISLVFLLDHLIVLLMLTTEKGCDSECSP